MYYNTKEKAEQAAAAAAAAARAKAPSPSVPIEDFGSLLRIEDSNDVDVLTNIFARFKPVNFLQIR